jgi:S1 RNA binding domain protein
MQAEVGAILEGKVTGLTDFGAFIELENGSTGMVHISEVASAYVKNIREYLELNQQVKVKVLSIGENGRINLSIKKVEEDAGEKQPRQPDRQRSPQKPGSNRRPPANVWQGSKPQPSADQSFEDMMARFKQVSDEKITDLKRSSEMKHGGGYSRRGAK